MGWAEHYRRRDAIELVLATEGDRLHYAELDSVRAAFPSREDLALALQYRWSRALAGRLDVTLVDAERFADVDHVGAVAAAWRATARRHPALRRLLDSYRAEAGPLFRAEVEAEQRTMALAAGLAGHDEPADEVTRVGAAFLALVRETPAGTARPARGGRPIEQLFRRLVASS
ncbi:MAG TPA: hypothetical protein VFW65_27145 [Pseudonocardiaceae bacterium]|nr:hypothetical protein [Pseudonocardiaceae bacterium]